MSRKKLFLRLKAWRRDQERPAPSRLWVRWVTLGWVGMMDCFHQSMREHEAESGCVFAD